MTTVPHDRQTIIGRVGLLGASAGIVLGLIEARCLRLADFPLPPSIWFLAPLLTSVAFGLLGLLAGFLASLPRSRMLGMGIIAGLAGLTGEYLAFVLRFSRSIIAFQHFLTPTILFAGFSAWTVAALWATRKPGSPLGFLADAPQRVWAGVVFASIATLAAALGISRLPDHLVESTTRAAGKTQSPNIVLIVLDTARADHFSSYGYFRNTTPNVDQFAERGVLFENAISASSWTLPSMFSVFTSLLPHQHGAGTYRAIEPRTLAEILREDGYETAGFNANPYYGIISRGLGRGFETYTDSTRSLGFSLDLTRIGRDFIESYSEEWFHRSRFNQFTAHQLNGEVYRWFDHRSDRPFFLFLNYNDAHEPYEVPAPYSHRYGTISENAKRMVFTSETCRFYLPPGEREGVIAAYDNSLSYIDSQIGELLAFLKRAPEWSNTYVIITADHGEGFGEHDDTYSHGLNLYREVLHVPLIMAGPGIPARVRVTDIAKTQRIFGTVLGWSGMKGEVLRRASLARLWSPGYAPKVPEEPTLSEVLENPALPDHRGVISITTREWQLICRPGFGSSRLYHWPTDPSEQQNVAELPENQALVDHLKATLLSIVERSFRPWRDPGYLVALSGPDFSPALEARKSIPSLPVGPLLPRGVGAAQILFPPNPETPESSSNPDEELLKSIPYAGGH